MSDGTGGHVDGRGRHLAGRASASSTAKPVWGRGGGVWHCQDKCPGLDAAQQKGRDSRRTPCLLPARWLPAVSAVGPGHVADKPRFSRICRVTAQAAPLLWHITDLPVSLKRERCPCPDASPGMDCVKSMSLSTWAGLLEGSWGVGGRWLTGTVTEARAHTTCTSVTWSSLEPRTCGLENQSLAKPTRACTQSGEGRAAGWQQTQPTAHGCHSPRDCLIAESVQPQEAAEVTCTKNIGAKTRRGKLITKAIIPFQQVNISAGPRGRMSSC